MHFLVVSFTACLGFNTHATRLYLVPLCRSWRHESGRVNRFWSFPKKRSKKRNFLHFLAFFCVLRLNGKKKRTSFWYEKKEQFLSFSMSYGVNVCILCWSQGRVFPHAHSGAIWTSELQAWLWFRRVSVRHNSAMFWPKYVKYWQKYVCADEFEARFFWVMLIIFWFVGYFPLRTDHLSSEWQNASMFVYVVTCPHET